MVFGRFTFCVDFDKNVFLKFKSWLYFFFRIIVQNFPLCYWKVNIQDMVKFS